MKLFKFDPDMKSKSINNRINIAKKNKDLFNPTLLSIVSIITWIVVNVKLIYDTYGHFYIKSFVGLFIFNIEIISLLFLEQIIIYRFNLNFRKTLIVESIIILTLILLGYFSDITLTLIIGPIIVIVFIIQILIILFSNLLRLIQKLS